jgi:hypothetical protein
MFKFRRGWVCWFAFLLELPAAPARACSYNSRPFCIAAKYLASVTAGSTAGITNAHTTIYLLSQAMVYHGLSPMPFLPQMLCSI